MVGWGGIGESGLGWYMGWDGDMEREEEGRGRMGWDDVISDGVTEQRQDGLCHDGLWAPRGQSVVPLGAGGEPAVPCVGLNARAYFFGRPSERPRSSKNTIATDNYCSRDSRIRTHMLSHDSSTARTLATLLSLFVCCR